MSRFALDDDAARLVSAAAARHVARIAARTEASGRPVSFDSVALIEYAAGREPVATLIAPLLESSSIPVVISTVAVVELVVRPARDMDMLRADAILARLRSLPRLSIVDLDQDHARKTAIVRASTGLKLPDAAIIATARLATTTALLGNDRRWRTAEIGVPYHHIDDILALR